RVLYTEQMEYWLEQWEEIRMYLGQRFDKKTCKEAGLVDKATGLTALHGVSVGATLKGRRNNYGQPAEDGTGFLEPPADRERWAREAQAAKPTAAPTPLAVRGFDVDFLPTSGSRILVHGMVQVMASPAPAEKNNASAEGGTEGDPQAHLSIEGV